MARIKKIDENGIEHICMRMTYGEPTGICHRMDPGHEYRLGYFREGIEIAVTSNGGFPIWPMLEKGKKKIFRTSEEALAWLGQNVQKFNQYDLLMKEE